MTATALSLALVLLTLQASTPSNAIRILASNGIKAVLEEVRAQSETAAGRPLSIAFGTSASLKQRIESGEAFDVAILTNEIVDDLIRQGRIQSRTRAGLGRAGIGVGVRAGSPKPDIRTPEALRRALLQAKSVTYAEGAGVAVNSKGHVFVFNRGNVSGPAFGATAAILLEFDQNGKYLREIGHNLYAWAYAHAVRVDKDDNIWAIDKGSDMVVKFNPQGRVVMVFGRKKESSDEAAPWTRVAPPRPPVDGEFRQPTDVTWDTQGNIFVSDGYINSRVAKFDKNGDWVKSFGEPGTKDGQFDTPHSIAADAAGNIYVADRGNFRIQVFNPDGRFLRSMKLNVPVPADARPWKGPIPTDDTVGSQHAGAPWAVCITPGPTQYLYTADAFPGRIYKLTLDGRILGVFGKAGKQPKQFGWIHEIACPSENELYVTEVVNWRVQKLLLHPRK